MFMELSLPLVSAALSLNACPISLEPMDGVIAFVSIPPEFAEIESFISLTLALLLRLNGCPAVFPAAALAYSPTLAAVLNLPPDSVLLESIFD